MGSLEPTPPDHQFREERMTRRELVADASSVAEHELHQKYHARACDQREHEVPQALLELILPGGRGDGIVLSQRVDGCSFSAYHRMLLAPSAPGPGG